jgi:cysteinyl-tRNA synthetase
MVALLCLLGVPVSYAADPEGQVTLEDGSSMTAQQKVDFSRSALEEMKTAVKTVEKLLEQAQKDKNAEQIECLGKKLEFMRKMLESGQTATNAMQQALSSNDNVHGDQEFRKIAVALSKLREFFAEALACTGSSGGEKAKSVATVNQNTEDLADGSQADDVIDPAQDAPVVGTPQ